MKWITEAYGKRRSIEEPEGFGQILSIREKIFELYFP